MFALHLLLYELQLHKLEKLALFSTISRGREQFLVSKILRRRHGGGISQLRTNCSPDGYRPSQGRDRMEKVLGQFQAPAPTGKGQQQAQGSSNHCTFLRMQDESWSVADTQ